MALPFRKEFHADSTLSLCQEITIKLGVHSGVMGQQWRFPADAGKPIFSKSF
jgi:hypothetical protein